MSSTSKPGHALTNKSSMKGLQRFTQIEMKKHDHDEDFFKCKRHGCMQGTKRVVDLICDNSN
jgi:hypothetical protein